MKFKFEFTQPQLATLRNAMDIYLNEMELINEHWTSRASRREHKSAMRVDQKLYGKMKQVKGKKK